jgi:hypothetical protein
VSKAGRNPRRIVNGGEWVQRFQCTKCLRRFTEDLKSGIEKKFEAAELYFDREASFRGVGRALGIKPHTALAWVNDLGVRCKSFTEVAKELCPQWDGWLFADGKAITVKGVEHALLLTADAVTQDIPTACLAPAEDFHHWQTVLQEVRDDLRFPLKGLILDGDPGLVAAAQIVFPSSSLQLCLLHAFRAWERYFKYQYKGSGRAVVSCATLVAEILSARTIEHKQEALSHWEEKRPAFIRCGLRKEVERLEAHLPFYFAFLDHPGMPETNNIMEGIIRQLSRKIHDTDGYERVDNAWNSLRLLIMRYRLHSFECSRIKGHNGLSPLELAGVHTKGIRWIEFSQRTT